MMKIRIEVDSACPKEEIVFRCSSLSEENVCLYEKLKELARQQETMVFYKDNTEYFLSLSSILFFETDGREVQAHTADNVYRTAKRLYELEELLPAFFFRISKSTILNLYAIYSLDRTLPSGCYISFADTYKKVYVSRHYYPILRRRLEERRSYI